MGLDMMLYRISRPETVKFEEHISYQRKNELCDTVYFEPVGSSKLSDTVINNSVMCFVEERYFDLKRVITDLYLYLNSDIDRNTAGEYADTFMCTGARFSNSETSRSMCTNNKKAVKALLRHLKYSHEIAKYELEVTDHWRVTATLVKDRGGYVGISFTCNEEEHPDYDGKYQIRKEEKVYAFEMERIAYQRKGLNDYGQSLLPENCSYCDDYDTVRQLVDAGGLSSEFIYSWEDGRTIFVPWW